MKTTLALALILVSLRIAVVHAAETAATTNPPPASVTLQDFKLVGELSGDRATFALTGTAQVENAKGGALDLITGTVALTEVGPHKNWQLRAESGRYVAVFERSGKYPVTVKFNAAVRQSEGWSAVEFRVAPAAVQPIVLRGLGEDTQFQFTGAARPERKGAEFVSFLPSDGAVKLAWKESRKAEEGKLFYAAEMLSQISVSPGLMRQIAVLDFKVMQGELSRVTFRLRGAGEVTRVAGEQVLAWNVEPLPDSADRRLVVALNQPQKDAFALQVQMQTPLGAFPQTATAMFVQPESATRFAGYQRIVNDGAVRLEVVEARGLSQISPEQFPESEATKALFRATGAQRFAYRFSSADFALRIQADQIQPELAASEVVTYHRGQNELVIEAELELDVREAPLRELLLRVPKGYALARLNASGMSDYFLREPADESDAELRVVYGAPVSGRQVVQLRLERNKPPVETNWALPRIEVVRAKSLRGNVGVSADAGFRLTPERTQALTEITTAFFPRKVANLQAAFRLSEPGWQATMRVERLPQTVQADVLHLFSIGEGVAYGSSVMSYLISGAPVSAFRVELSDEYFNVEFTGKDVRNWQKTTNGYLVQLHTPVSGAYTLLASYERPFKAQGETLGFVGARPADAQSEQGYTLVISAYQFQVKPVEVSTGLLPLETGEVPAEYRLFFDAPILAAYRYTMRPFNLQLALSPLAQGDSLNQVVDRAALRTRISKEGQLLTDATYFVKNRGNPNFRLTLPTGVELWSATVDGASVVPVKDGSAHLIPLPQRADPNAALQLELKLAAKSKEASRVIVAAPIVHAPIMLGEWKLEPDAGQRLTYRKGSLTPIGGVPDVSGFAQLARLVKVGFARGTMTPLLAALGMLVCALVVWRWTTREGVGKFSARHLCGTALGLVAALMAGLALAHFAGGAADYGAAWPSEVTLLAPVQQPNSSLSVEVANEATEFTFSSFVQLAWPALLALAAWVYGWVREDRATKFAGKIVGWTALAWMTLRWPSSVPAFCLVVGAFVAFHVVLPTLRKLWSLPRAPRPAIENGSAPAVAALLVGGLLWLSFADAAFAGSADLQSAVSPISNLRDGSSNPAAGRLQVGDTADYKSALRRPQPALAESITQQIRVEEDFALATAKVRWQATRGQVLPLLFEPAVLTRINYPSNALKLVQSPAGARRAQQLLAEKSGAFDIEVQYQLRVTKREGENGFTLPTPYGLINQLALTLASLDVDVLSPQAVSVQRELAGSNTVAAVVLSPVNDAWIGWKPRSRDVKREKPVFYADLRQLYVPAAGVIEGTHFVSIRPAQGELSELVFNVPSGATITDVLDGSSRREEAPSTNQKSEQSLVTSASTGSLVSLWRFDPDSHKLRVTLNPAQSRPFVLVVRSQVAAGPLPFEQAIGLLSVDGAAGQIGLLGVATGNEVQLDTVSAETFSAINLEDFPADATKPLAGQIAGLTVRRAFRYADPKATASLKASPVEPDVRVEMQDTLSLGEDRTVLAANATVDITRAGIFRLSFVMPAGFDVESITGAALSHWTEFKSDTGRVITLHLKGKTEGRQQFAISLAGPGVKATNSWSVPQVTLREASKQQGTLLVVPEQGMQLQATTLEGLSQLDPQRAGIRQKGVLAFRVLQTPRELTLKIEQVAPWVQVTSLQHATVNEAQMKFTVNLQYQIENTGLKALRVRLPANAEGVRFAGEQVADFLAVAGAVTNGLQLWEVKLQRRIIGPYLLQATYQTTIPEQATEAPLTGVQAADVNLQRGFVTVQSGGRLQVHADAVPAALRPTEWQSIPRALRQNLASASANLAYRLVEPAFQLPLKLDRHAAAKLLAARVNNITFTSVISDEGVMLTQVRLEMLPGDKRLLHLTLPKDAKFWFAFVNQNGVWPWREQDRILIPLEPSSGAGIMPAEGRQAGSLPHYKPTPVEVFYSSRIGEPGGHALDLQLVAPKFDLPLEDITWRVYLSEKWRLKDWTGTLQLQEEKVVPATAALDLQRYLQGEVAQQREKTQEAEQMLALGNSALEKGDPQQARRAFQAAFGLSTHDNAFNEDARVQLHNLKLQQALVGLNVRQAAVASDAAFVFAPGGRLRDVRGLKDVRYTQQDAKEIIDRNTDDDNSAYMRLAEKLVQQQDAAVANPAAIRASIPEQGRLLTFQRAVAVDQWADLHVELQTRAVRPASWSVRAATLAFIVALLAGLAWFAGGFRQEHVRTAETI
jgi:hypothetical protein